MSIHSLQEGFEHSIPNTSMSPNKGHWGPPLWNPMYTHLIMDSGPPAACDTIGHFILLETLISWLSYHSVLLSSH